MHKPFVLPIQTPRGKYLYEVNRNEVLYVSDELFNYVCNVLQSDDINTAEGTSEGKKQFAELVDFGYLSSNRIERIEHPATKNLVNYLDRSIERITLQVTQNCNLRCKYCVYSESTNFNQRSHTESTMSFEIAKAAIDFYRKHTVDKEKVGIGFYGGEPLLAFSLIKRVVEYAKEVFEGKELSFSMTTNATILNQEIVEFLLSNNFLLTFSLDGPERVQNKNRIFRDGTGSFSSVINNIRSLFAKDSKKLQGSVINMVVDPSQEYDELLSLFDEPALKNIDVRYTFVEKDNISLPPSAEFVSRHNYDEFISLFQYFRGDNHKYLNKLMEQDIRSFDLTVGKFASISMQQTFSLQGTCIPGKLRLLVNCFGDFYPCEKVNENNAMKIGNLDTGFDYHKIQDLLNIGQINCENCKNCWAISLCSACPRVIDGGKELHIRDQKKTCNNLKDIAYKKILQKILVFENEQHIRAINASLS